MHCARVDPTNKTDRVTWLASQVTPLVIQLLNGDLQQEYERFKEKTIAISGIKILFPEPLTFPVKANALPELQVRDFHENILRRNRSSVTLAA